MNNEGGDNMVKRYFNGECVNHVDSCTCKVCEGAKSLEGFSITTEQGMFGDLSSEFGLKNHSEQDAE